MIAEFAENREKSAAITFPSRRVQGAVIDNRLVENFIFLPIQTIKSIECVRIRFRPLQGLEVDLHRSGRAKRYRSPVGAAEVVRMRHLHEALHFGGQFLFV